MNIKQKLTTAAITGSMLAAVLLPGTALAAGTVKIKNNGALSTNKAKIVNNSSKTVVQGNKTVATTFVNTSANTGGNKSKFNVGGTNTINTGAASNTVDVSVTGGTNTNSGDECGCAQAGESTVTISGNGALSYNKAKIVNNSSNTVVQGNATIVFTSVSASADTGNNSTSFNVGGENSITTETATNDVTVTVEGSTNTN